jgi:thiamine-monophosphate kinase
LSPVRAGATPPPDTPIAEVGEQALLALLHRYCNPNRIGDDGAIVTPRAGYDLVIATDGLVQDVHFSEATTPAEAVGWRAAAVNLSDLAAMGATPIGLTLALSLPGTLPWQWLEGFYNGMVACLATYGGEILGGDLSRSPILTLGVTALGEVHPTQALRRSVAQPGDRILVTGWHGASRAGLEWLLNPDWGRDVPSTIQREWVNAHQRPRPRFDVVNALHKLGGLSLRVAAMDSSDGLADAILQLCRASGVGANIWGDRIPIHPGLRQTQSLTLEQALDWTLYGGEDFELVLCLPAQLAEALLTGLSEGGLESGAAIIGEITVEPDVLLEWHSQQIPLTLSRGFQHWSAPDADRGSQ